jgi:hypothetical protein
VLIPVQKISNEIGKFTLFSIKDDPKYNYVIRAESSIGKGSYSLKIQASLAVAKEMLYYHASCPTDEELYQSLY